MRVEDSSQVSEARRLALAAGRSLGFDESLTGRTGLVVTELATNLLKHGGGGAILLRSIRRPEAPGLEILALDKGPGITRLAECLRDGHSTTGSPGTGLGAIQRLSSLFDVCAPPGKGTAVLSRISAASAPETVPPVAMNVGAVCVPAPSEEACGDAWAAHQGETRTTIAIADGLGHGILAAEASAEAMRVFERNVTESPKEILGRIHQALRSTRGAAVAVAEILHEERVVHYAGLGNTSGLILAGESSRNMVSENGTAGGEVRKIQEFTYPWPERGVLILHSDGLKSHWSMGGYPGLHLRHPSLVAGVLFRDHCRGRDDTCIVVAVPREG